jgi:hypothetical protein
MATFRNAAPQQVDEQVPQDAVGAVPESNGARDAEEAGAGRLGVSPRGN